MTSKKKIDPAAAVVAAKGVLAQRQNALSAANAAAHDLLDRLDRGDDTVTSGDTMRSREDVANAARLLAAAEAAVKRAERAVPNDETTLAAALVESGLLAAVLPGVPLTVTTVRPSKAPDVTPASVLVQARASVVDDIVGTIGGNVELFYFSTPLHRSVEAEHVAREAQARRINLTANGQGSSETDGVVTQRISLDVSHARAVVPVVQALDFGGRHGHFVNQFGQGLAQTARDAMQSHGSPTTGVRIGSGVSGQSFTVTTWSRADLRSQAYSADGTCRTVLTVTLKAYPGRSCHLTGAELQAQVVKAVENLRGDCASALGRATDVKILHVGMIEGAGTVARAVEAEVQFVSALPAGAAVPGRTQPARTASVPAQRPAEDVREHLDTQGTDKRRHPGIVK